MGGNEEWERNTNLGKGERKTCAMFRMIESWPIGKAREGGRDWLPNKQKAGNELKFVGQPVRVIAQTQRGEKESGRNGLPSDAQQEGAPGGNFALRMQEMAKRLVEFFEKGTRQGQSEGEKKWKMTGDLAERAAGKRWPAGRRKGEKGRARLRRGVQR